MAAELTLRWPPSWIADVVNTIGPLYWAAGLQGMGCRDDSGKDPHKHLKEFHVVCFTMRPQGISEDYIKMKAFPFSLDGAAKDWLYLQPVLFNTWGEMKHTFLEKFFSGIQNCVHQEGDMWDKATYRRDFA
ncbi:hypothetical protein CR513_50040, partial [Mucuna pruriens]